jgi:hypothetical protein
LEKTLNGIYFWRPSAISDKDIDANKNIDTESNCDEDFATAGCAGGNKIQWQAVQVGTKFICGEDHRTLRILLMSILSLDIPVD